MELSNVTKELVTPSKAQLLLVDDSQTDLRLLIDLLTLRNLQVSIAMNGAMAISLAETLNPDLILMDVRMPTMDGLTACRRLKANALTSAIPIIFLTSANELIDRLEGFAAGAVDYIAKPFDALEVIARVGVHLQRNTIASEVSDSLVTRDERLLTAAQTFLRSRISTPPGLDELALQLSSNRRRLNDVFQSLCGQPVFGWLREERLRQAYQFVSLSSLSFSQISDRLGYSTPTNFTKAFRQRYGFSPREVRRRISGLDQPDIL